jgi:hypothetical protein
MSGDDGRIFAEARDTAFKLGNSLAPIEYSSGFLKFRRDVADGNRPWGVGSDGGMCARRSTNQKRNDYSIFSSSPPQPAENTQARGRQPDYS